MERLVLASVCICALCTTSMCSPRALAMCVVTLYIYYPFTHHARSRAISPLIFHCSMAVSVYVFDCMFVLACHTAYGACFFFFLFAR